MKWGKLASVSSYSMRNTFFPIRDEQGQIRRTGGIAQDITRHEGRFVYVANDDGQTSVFSISRRTGALKELVGSPFPFGGLQPQFAFLAAP